MGVQQEVSLKAVHRLYPTLMNSFENLKQISQPQRTYPQTLTQFHWRDGGTWTSGDRVDSHNL